MKGRNTLIFNTATMIEAVQMLLSKQMPFHAPTVTTVKLADSYAGTFEISVSSDDEEENDK